MVKVIISGAYASRIIQCFQGYPTDITQISHVFKDIREKIKLLSKSDVIHITSINTIGKDGLKWFFILSGLKLLNKKIILHWVGTDVMGLNETYAAFLSKVITKQLAIAPWLVDELHEKGIEADYMFMPMKLDFSNDELPKRLSVLIYLGAVQRNKFYGSKILEKLVESFPEIRFLVVGDALHKLSHENITYYGTVSVGVMDEIYKQTTVVLRPTEHDGLSNMVLEALARGRYVIWSRQFPYCYYATEYSDIVKYLNELKQITFINNTGIDYVRSNFSSDVWVPKLIKLYEKLGG